MLGNPGACFECGHEHGVGDRCLSFHFDPGFFEEIVASVPRAQRLTFTTPRLSPSGALLPMISAAEAADDDLGFEEAALRVAAAAVTVESGAGETVRNLRHESRVTEALRRIEAEPEEPATVRQLARDATMSPYHFLRTVAGSSGSASIRRRASVTRLSCRRLRTVSPAPLSTVTAAAATRSAASSNPRSSSAASAAEITGSSASDGERRGIVKVMRRARGTEATISSKNPGSK